MTTTTPTVLTFTVYPVDSQEPFVIETTHPALDKPSYRQLQEWVEPYLAEGADMEHVTVLHKDLRCDLFVDELSANKRLPRNEAATAIYRNNSLTHDPKLDPETLPAIYGPAILFHQRVWF